MHRVAAVLLSALALTSVQAEPVRIDSGLVEGVTLGSGVRAWLGIPQAAPPLRELRWRAPQPVPRWDGVFHADRPAPMCLQVLRTRTMNHYFGNEATSEDCLYLNVWAPARAERLPVIVWIYGGGFTVGSANMANYSGETLAASGVVRVNLAYRLGALGFLAHPELTRESGYGGSGNYGLMDLVAGLQWVQRNIAAFGGDPGQCHDRRPVRRVDGSGAAAIEPAARGLFTKVVGMSGSPFGEPMRAVALEQGEAAGLALGQALSASSIEDLRDIGGGSDRRGTRAHTDRRRRALRDRSAAGVRVAAAQRRADHDRLHARRVVPLTRRP